MDFLKCVRVCLRWIFPQTRDKELPYLFKNSTSIPSFHKNKKEEARGKKEKKKKSTSSSTTRRREIYMTIQSRILQVPPYTPIRLTPSLASSQPHRVWRRPRSTFPGSQYLPAELCTAALPGASSSSSSSSSSSTSSPAFSQERRAPRSPF